MNKSITRLILAKLVSKKLRKGISHSHINPIISILFEEINNDLMQGDEVKIGKFLTIKLVKTNPRRHMNIWTQKISWSKGRFLLRMNIQSGLLKLIKKHLDVEKSFKNDSEEKTPK